MTMSDFPWYEDGLLYFGIAALVLAAVLGAAFNHFCR
jgi:hypothetical protein